MVSSSINQHVSFDLLQALQAVLLMLDGLLWLEPSVPWTPSSAQPTTAWGRNHAGCAHSTQKRGEAMIHRLDGHSPRLIPQARCLPFHSSTSPIIGVSEILSFSLHDLNHARKLSSFRSHAATEHETLGSVWPLPRFGFLPLPLPFMPSRQHTLFSKDLGSRPLRFSSRGATLHEGCHHGPWKLHFHIRPRQRVRIRRTLTLQRIFPFRCLFSCLLFSCVCQAKP